MPARGRKENRNNQRSRVDQANQAAQQGRIDQRVNQDTLTEAGEELGLSAEQVNQVIQANPQNQRARQQRAQRRQQQ